MGQPALVPFYTDNYAATLLSILYPTLSLLISNYASHVIRTTFIDVEQDLDVFMERIVSFYIFATTTTSLLEDRRFFYSYSLGVMIISLTRLEILI